MGKKASSKKSAGNSKSTAKKNNKKKTSKEVAIQKNRGPLYILIIMLLLTAIITLINRFYFNHIPEKVKVSEKLEIEEVKDEKQNDVVDEKELDNEEEASITSYKKAKLYFIKMNDKTEKMYLTSVYRKFSNNGLLLKNILNQLVKGPLSEEKRKGLMTAIPADLKIYGIRMRNQTAEINFSTAIEKGAGGNILISRIDQIVYTATQFDNVDSIIIKVNGKTRDSLGSDGLSISGPIHRRK